MNQVDLERLRGALRQMSRGHLLMVAEQAIEIVTTAKLRALLGDIVRLPLSPKVSTSQRPC